ncbi:MAG: HAMP domain-containing protein [Anaerolineales bacterium]|nr:HAMP domain-containing protein [Anaerolineales bacterium]
MRSISLKLVISFLVVTAASVASIVLFIRWITNQEFNRFLENQNQNDITVVFSQYYESNDSWEGIQDANLSIMPWNEPREERKPPFALADETGLIVRSGASYEIGEMIPASKLEEGLPIEADNLVVGTILFTPRSDQKTLPNPAETHFISSINKALLFSAIGTSLLALLLGIVLSRTLTRPIRELTEATRAVSSGNLSLEVPVRSKDELGELAVSFNKMSTSLERSINARRQMTADVAHELRTPLSIILGHADGVHDGVLKPSKENFEIIREEASRLDHLIEDLRTLSLADAGELRLEPQSVSIKKILDEVTNIFGFKLQQKKLSLNLSVSPNLPEIVVDPIRIVQVLTNILENALKYTPENGLITISAQVIENWLEITTLDCGPGVEPENLEYLFDRFYRTDPSRHRDQGGSGLGLAIAKSIVQAHSGQIRAENKPGAGLKISMRLPLKY